MKALYSMIGLHLYMVMFREKFLLTFPLPEVSLCVPLRIKISAIVMTLALVEGCLVFFISSIRHLLRHFARNKRLLKQQPMVLNSFLHVTHVNKS